MYLIRAVLFCLLFVSSCSLSQPHSSIGPGSSSSSSLYPVDIYPMTNKSVSNLILVYFAAANDLVAYAVDNIGQIERSIAAVRARGDDVLIYFGTFQSLTGWPAYANYFPGYTPTSNGLYLFPGGAFEPMPSSGQYYQSRRVYTNQNRNTGDPQSLIEFISFAKSKYTYQTVSLVIWNHGSAFYPMGSNVTINRDITPFPVPISPLNVGYTMDYEDSLTDPEIRYAVTNTLGKVSVFAIDACIMGGIENAYEYRNICDYYVGATDFIPAYGFPYDIMLSNWAATNQNTPAALARCMVDGYNRYYHYLNTNLGVTLYSMKMPEAANELANELNTLAGVVLSVSNVNREWMQARWYPSSNSGTDPGFYDIDQYVNSRAYPIDYMVSNLAAKTGNGTLATLSAQVKTTFDSYIYAPVIATSYLDFYSNVRYRTNYTGPTFYAPQTYSGIIQDLEFGWYSSNVISMFNTYPDILAMTTGENHVFCETTKNQWVNWTRIFYFDGYSLPSIDAWYLPTAGGIQGFTNYTRLSNTYITRTNAVMKADFGAHYYKFTVDTPGTFQIWIAANSASDPSSYFNDSHYMIEVYNSSQQRIGGLTLRNLKDGLYGNDMLSAISTFSSTNNINTNYQDNWCTHYLYNFQTTLSSGDYYLVVDAVLSIGWYAQGYTSPYLMFLGTNNTCTFQ